VPRGEPGGIGDHQPVPRAIAERSHQPCHARTTRVEVEARQDVEERERLWHGGHIAASKHARIMLPAIFARFSCLR
jgi:hypothetical protein